MDSDVPIGLKDFLEEAELDQYHVHFRDILKVTKTSQLKYVNSVDLKELGLSKPEQRRYKKLYTKYFGKHYLTRIRKLLSSSKKNETPVKTAAPTVKTEPVEDITEDATAKHIIPVEDITINKELGTGEFGVVQQGTWTKNNQRIQVAIKCLGQERMNSNSMEFLKEASVMHSIEHPNIVRLYGVVLHLQSPMLVTELAPLRSLLECLKEYTLRESFPVLTLCNFAEQICDGMTYLENKRLIHRDLAARNILVFNKDKVKISDFGLSRSLGVGKDYYQTNYNVNLKLPVAWCAAECITYLKFTSASDVWAYAVTLWEMFSYGFQPWAAFSGQQILTAIDEPNFQRLERPECCPEQYYATMLECWAHDPADRPKFKDLNVKLSTIRPEQVIAKTKTAKVEGRRTNLLYYNVGDQITVIGKEALSESAMWVGVMSNGACGQFSPSTTIPYIPPAAMSSPTAHPSSTVLGCSKTAGGLLSSTLRSSLSRSDSKRHTYTPKRTIQRDMISAPQGEVKHMGHVGPDGAHFGDVAFLNSPNADPPRQIVNPYKPSQDLEEVPLLNPNSPSNLTGGPPIPYHLLEGATAPRPPPRTTPLTQQTTVHSEMNEAASTGQEGPSRLSSKRFGFKSMQPTTSRSFMSKVKSATLGKSFRHDDKTPSTSKTPEGIHEYQEIDNESSLLEQPPPDLLRKSQSDFSQSLIDEMECIFQNLYSPPQTTATTQTLKKASHPNQRAQTLGHFNKKRNQGEIVKPMSAHEQKTLETAVALANEITSRSMNDLDCKGEKVPPSPNERSKFHFKFPSMSHPHASQEPMKETPAKPERRNFSQEAQSVPDLQSTITKESRLAYASLIEEPTASSSLINQIAQDGATVQPLLHPGRNSSAAHRTAKRNPDVPNKTHARQTSLCNTEIGLRKIEKDTHQMINVLPLPSKGSKPPLVDKTRHIRIHPLVMTGSMRKQLETENKQLYPVNNCAQSCLQHVNRPDHNYQNFCCNGPRVAEAKKEHIYVLPKKNHNDHKKCKPEPEYMNMIISKDVCDGRNISLDGTKEPHRESIATTEKEISFENNNTPHRIEIPNSGNDATASSSEEAKYNDTIDHATYNSDLGALLKDAPDHVSVEDLLEFADQKPCGRQRGVESDEVRILSKVLNYEMPMVTKEECLSVLDNTDWRVHSALKVFRLRAQVNCTSTLSECASALAASDGDITKACSLLQLDNTNAE